MKIKSGYLLRNIEGEWVIFPIGNDTLDFNGLLRVNETGVFLWRMLESEIEYEILVTALLEEYPVDRQTAEKDLDDFLSFLSEYDMLISSD